MIKTIEINGKLYSAEKVGSYTPPKEKPVRITDEYVLPKHTSLFVKTLEDTIESNLQEAFSKLESQISQLKKEAFELIMKGDKSNFEAKFEEAKNIELLIKEFKSNAKLLWMNRIALKYNELTQQIAGRLPY